MNLNHIYIVFSLRIIKYYLIIFKNYSVYFIRVEIKKSQQFLIILQEYLDLFFSFKDKI